MPYYIRTSNGSQIYNVGGAAALSVAMDASLIRGPYTDTWQVAGDGPPVPTSVTVTAWNVRNAPGTPSVPTDIIGVGWESDGPGGHEWERTIMGVRRVRIPRGSLCGEEIVYDLYAAPRITRLYRWVSGGGNEMADHTTAMLVFTEEV